MLVCSSFVFVRPVIVLYLIYQCLSLWFCLYVCARAALYLFFVLYCSCARVSVLVFVFFCLCAHLCICFCVCRCVFGRRSRASREPWGRHSDRLAQTCTQRYPVDFSFPFVSWPGCEQLRSAQHVPLDLQQGTCWLNHLFLRLT